MIITCFQSVFGPALHCY